MAVISNESRPHGWFSNAFGQVNLGNFSIFDKDKVAKFAVGTRFVRQDGNKYVYSHFGADVDRGVLVATDTSESSVVDSDNVIVAPSSANDTSDGTIGSKFVEITLATVTDGQYAGGYFVTTDGTGPGYTYRIKGNTAVDIPASGTFRLELHEPLQLAISSDTDFAIQGCIWANLEIATAGAGTDVVLAGVTVSTMDVSEQVYGWVLTRGVVGILVDPSAPSIGDNIVPSSGVSGAVMEWGGTSPTTILDLLAEQRIGYCLIAGSSTRQGVFWVNIA